MDDALQPGADPTAGIPEEFIRNRPDPYYYRGLIADPAAGVAYRWAAAAVKGRSVLDLGCGDCHETVGLLDAGPASLSGAEPKRELADLGERLCGDRVALVVSEPDALPFEDSSFDVVVCIGLLEHAPNPLAASAEIARVLRDDGCALVGLLAAPEVNGPIAAALARHLPAAAEYSMSMSMSIEPITDATDVAPGGEPHSPAGPAGSPRLIAAAAKPESLPELALGESLDLGALAEYRQSLHAWEQRARVAEAEGAAKHWELVAAREAQRRLRKRLHEIEHRPTRQLIRVIRRQPRRLGPGPPIRATERGVPPWDQ